MKVIRISAVVDEDIRNILDDLAKKEDKTMSDIIRHAILLYSKVKNLDVSVDSIEEYLEILSRDNIIIDIELWLTILDELNKVESEKFWEAIEKLGYKHGLELKNRSNDIEQILKYLSLRNLFEFKKIEGGYSLILATRSETRVLKKYLEGLFKSLGIDVEIVESLRKLMIVQRQNKKKGSS